jgi:membrane protein
MKDIVSLFKDAFSSFGKDNVTSWSAALSYYAAFALSPLLLLIISLLSLFVSKATVQNELVNQIRGLVGNQGAIFIKGIIENAKQSHGEIIGTIISFVLLALGASGVFGQLQTTLNHIFHVEPKPDAGLMHLIVDRFLSFSMIVAISFLLLISLVASTLINVVSAFFTHLLPLSSFFVESFNFVFSLGAITLLFMLVFAVMPDVKIPRKVLLFGSFTTALLFTIGKTLIGIYLGRGTTSSFGAAASLATVLVWLYYSSLIFFFGAELMKSYAFACNINLEPKKDAKISTPIVKVKPAIKERGFFETILSYLFSGLFLAILTKVTKKKKKWW